MSEQSDEDLRAIKQALFGWPPGQGGLINEVKDSRTECRENLEALRDHNDQQHEDDRKSIRNLIFSILISGLAVVMAQVLTR